MDEMIVAIFSSLALTIILISLLLFISRDLKIMNDISIYRRKLNFLSNYLTELENGNFNESLKINSSSQVVCLPFYNESSNELKRICI